MTIIGRRPPGKRLKIGQNPALADNNPPIHRKNCGDYAPRAGLKLKQNLTRMRRRCHPRLSLGRLGVRIDAIDHRLDPARLD